MKINAYDLILELTDEAVLFVIAARQKDPGLRDFGGQIAYEKGFAEPGSSGSATTTLLSAYFCGDSKWNKDEAVLEAAIASLVFLNEMCHEDGSIDLVETNFHDCTSNAFTVQGVAYAYRLLAKRAETAREREALALAKSFLEKSARAMLTGGFHTPNHRWVVASALALCYKCLGGEELLAKAREYLSEGIDINTEGDYTERSVGIYDAVNNESLAIIAEELEMPELYKAVDKNLEKNIYFFEPDMTAFTLASRRQDYGDEARPVRHYYTYYREAVRTGDGRFANMANALLTQIKNLRVYNGTPRVIASSLHHQNLLTRFMLEPPVELLNEKTPQKNYDKYFSIAGVVRHRKNDWTCGLLRDSSVFMKLQTGSMKIYAKLACTFFQFGRLLADEIVPIENGYRLASERVWGYVKPLPGINEPDWHKIDKSLRGDANMQTHRWITEVVFMENGIELKIKTEGTPRIPMKLELILPPGGLLRTGGATFKAAAGGWAIIGDFAEYDFGGEKIKITGGMNEHDYAPNMRNSDPQPADKFCLYCTGFTPVERVIKIELG